MFRVGQKVVCVNGAQSSVLHKAIVKGSVYTIRAIGDDGDPKGPWVILAEVVNAIAPSILWNGQPVRKEPVYSATRFRPIVERKTDISFAHEILRKASKKVPDFSVSSGVRTK